MIVVAGSLKKSGSGWLFNMTNELLGQEGKDDVRSLRDRKRNHDLIRGENCQTNVRKPGNVLRLLGLHFQGHSFVVKTHSRLSPVLHALSRTEVCRPIHSIRDPRDVVLSLLDHATRLREAGTPNSIASIESFEESLSYTKHLLDSQTVWLTSPHVCTVQYESLIMDPLKQMERVAEFLGLDPSTETLKAIVNRYVGSGNKNVVDAHRMHFNKGRADRYQEEMSEDELNRCNQALGPWLTKLGYSL